MIDVLHAAADLQTLCESQRWRFCFIGGVALLRWGEPRETVDVDISLLTGFGDEAHYVRFLLDRYEARIDQAEQFALTHRVLLLRAPSGVGLDVALSGIPFEESAVARSSLYAFDRNYSLRTCSAEDLIVMKAFASREKDWVDVEGVIIRQSSRLDWEYIYSQLKPLLELKGTPENLAELERRRTKLNA